MASGLLAAGMSWSQALLTILLGNTIVLIPILLNSHPGTKYGIPFPVFARAAYGTSGSNLPALMRALVACGWFGINAGIGGGALQTFFASLWAGGADLLGHTFPMWGSSDPVVIEPFHVTVSSIHPFYTTQWIAFALFWGLNVFVIFRGMELLRRVERWPAPDVLVMTASLVGWAVNRAGGLGPILDPNSHPGTKPFLSVM